MEIYPAILSDSVVQVQHQLDLVKDHDQINLVQIDVIDGLYADNMTVTPVDLIGLDFGGLKIDFHLMVEEPLDYVHEIAQCQEQLPVSGVLAQIERMTSLEEYLAELKKHKLQAGVSLDLPTPVSAVADQVWSQIEMVQLMAISAGFQGQKFDKSVLDKIDQVKQVCSQDTKIIVDGGIKLEHVEHLSDYQVSAASVGSLLWTSGDIGKTIDQLYQNES